MSLIIYIALVAIVISVMLGSYYLGPRHSERSTATPYESGISTTGNARIRFPVHFYAVAMFFVVFDLESVFLYAWSTAVRELGWPGFWRALVFISVLLIALFYLFRVGALDIGPKLRKPRTTTDA